MKKLYSTKIANYLFSYQQQGDKTSTVIASIYHLNPIKTLHCFVLTTVTKKLDLPSSYGVFFIDSGHKKIFEYEMPEHIEKFDAKILPTIEFENENDCFALIAQNGYALISENHTSVEKLLQRHGVIGAKDEIIELLNKEVISVLTQLRLGVVPKVYNWLAEVKYEQYSRRVNALLNYPIVLIPLVSPTMQEMLPPIVPQDILSEGLDEVLSKISKRIDAGDPIHEILQSELLISEGLLAIVKKLTYWNVPTKLKPRVYAHFGDEIAAWLLICNE